MWRFEALCKVPLLAPLTPAQRSNLCTLLRSERYTKGDIIIPQVHMLGDSSYPSYLTSWDCRRHLIWMCSIKLIMPIICSMTN